mmetsp:Transcript_14495/g.22660  ORF Transcript_14495/g.22660 Transcript_14495/m.22660 type:complete len:160 (+) Transcript_14495:118-597(+)
MRIYMSLKSTPKSIMFCYILLFLVAFVSCSDGTQKATTTQLNIKGGAATTTKVTHADDKETRLEASTEPGNLNDILVHIKSGNPNPVDQAVAGNVAEMASNVEPPADEPCQAQLDEIRELKERQHELLLHITRLSIELKAYQSHPSKPTEDDELQFPVD